jgi:hypothetical protein
MAHTGSSSFIRNAITLFLLGLATGYLIALWSIPEPVEVRPGTPDTPAALTSVNLMIDDGTRVRTWNTVSWHEAMSVQDLLGALVTARAIELQTEVVDGIENVKGIDGVSNDAESGRSWRWWVNNTEVPRPAAKYYLKPGDIVVWRYGAQQDQPPQ